MAKMADKGKKDAKSFKKEIKEKTQLILQSTTNANYLVDIIELSDTDSEDVLLCFIKSVHKIFAKFMKDHKMFTSEKTNQEFETKDADKPVTEDDSEYLFNYWLFEKYNIIVVKLLKNLHSKSKNVQELSLCTLMKFMVSESKAISQSSKKPPFPNNFFWKIFNEMVHPTADMSEIIERFSEYLEYDDVRFYVMKNMHRALEIQREKSEKDGLFTKNAYAMLCKVKMPSTEEELGSFLIGNNAQKVATTEEVTDMKTSKKDARSIKAHKKAFSTAWLNFLSLPLCSEIHKKVLLNLHSDVIPHLQDPKLLIDFLTDSYNTGGVTSLLALNGLFILIHKHNLDYPDFYKKLYALLQPGIFHVKYMPRFFQLLDLFLSSTHLPSYLVAAFIKRLSGLALSAPPSGAMLVIKFVSNLLKRHPSCQVLIHSKDTSKLLLSSDNPNITLGSEEEDSFLPDEPDPAKCNALQSSLWELKSLQQHYFPEMTPLIEGLEKPFGKLEVDVEEHFEVGYDDLFEKQCSTATLQNAVLEYQPPKRMLGKQFLDLWSVE